MYPLLRALFREGISHLSNTCTGLVLFTTQSTPFHRVRVTECNWSLPVITSRFVHMILYRYEKIYTTLRTLNTDFNNMVNIMYNQ